MSERGAYEFGAKPYDIAPRPGTLFNDTRVTPSARVEVVRTIAKGDVGKYEVELTTGEHVIVVWSDYWKSWHVQGFTPPPNDWSKRKNAP